MTPTPESPDARRANLEADLPSLAPELPSLPDELPSLADTLPSPASELPSLADALPSVAAELPSVPADLPSVLGTASSPTFGTIDWLAVQPAADAPVDIETGPAIVTPLEPIVASRPDARTRWSIAFVARGLAVLAAAVRRAFGASRSSTRTSRPHRSPTPG